MKTTEREQERDEEISRSPAMSFDYKHNRIRSQRRDVPRSKEWVE